MKWLRIIAFPLCVVLLLAAFGVRFYFNQWNKISIGILIACGVFFIISIILEWKNIIESFKKRSYKYGLSSSLSILLIVAILVVVNFICFKHYKRFDLTEQKKFSLSPQTVQLLKNLPRPVHIITFFSSEQPMEPRRFSDLMREFLSHTSQITTESYDFDLSPQQAQQYSVNIPGTIVFLSGRQTEKINKVDEESAINAILKVTKDIMKVVYFLEGHQELSIGDTSKQGISIFKERLQKENYAVKNLILANTPGVPAEASAVIIAGSTLDLLENEIEALNKYVAAGGRLLLFIDPSSAPGMTKIANKWGINVEDDIVVDAMQKSYGGDEFIPQVHSVYGSPISETFSLIGFFPYTRTIVNMEDIEEGLDVRKIVESTENTWAEFDKNVVQYDEGIDRQGAQSVAVAARQKLKGTSKELRVIAFGDTDFIRNGWFNMLGNGNLALNSVAWLAEEGQLIAVKDKPEMTAQLPFEPSLLKNFMKFSQYLLPGAIVIAGIIIWIRRRKL